MVRKLTTVHRTVSLKTANTVNRDIYIYYTYIYMLRACVCSPFLKVNPDLKLRLLCRLFMFILSSFSLSLNINCVNLFVS